MIPHLILEYNRKVKPRTRANKLESKKTIKNVKLYTDGEISICHVSDISDELKELIRKNLVRICAGAQTAKLGGEAYSYRTVTKQFLERYRTKNEKTKIGMVGEFLSHILIIELFKEYKVSSPFFNMEEASIRKGFDIILYRKSDKTTWITEVKSGNLHNSKDHDTTTYELLYAARSDLQQRLNEQKATYWYEAINSVQLAFDGAKSHKSALISILQDTISHTTRDTATSLGHNVFLVSNLFEPLDVKISHAPATKTLKQLRSRKIFRDETILCVQKGTHEKIISFLEQEASSRYP